tara:strand:- start:3594 stop:4142 length:549 start_codon:yes stop_codon:yes gene_type:complete
MRFNLLIKTSPFLSILLLTLVISFSNQNQYTKLRILIWETPLLSLATYLSISTGSGFIFSYFLTNNLANIYKSKSINSLKYKIDENKDDNEDIETNIKHQYDYTLIERNIKDPAPTINANFRVIGRTERDYSDSLINRKNNIEFVESDEYDEQFAEQTSKDETLNQDKPISIDWNDESYTKW